ncbi:hypothetical protein JCM10207_007613 [Rhodosporidiobolus poonsookiae]
MLSRSTQVLRSAAQRAPQHARTAATAAPAPYKRTYTPRSTSRPAARTATPSSTSSAAAKAAQAASAAPKSAPAPEPAVEAAAPTPILDAIPDELDIPPLASTNASAGSSFVRKTPNNPFEPSASLPASSASFEASTSASPAPFPSAPPPEIDWSTSYHGLSAVPFTKEQGEILMRPLEAAEIEIKPDGLLYLPEILYRRILNKAFGPGGWGMVPRGEMSVIKNMVTREWGLVAGGRLVSVARGEQTFFDPSGMPTATEGCKSNALMRCCKDLGIASELWDPAFIRVFKHTHCVEAWTEHATTKKKQKRWRKKNNKFEYPYIAQP